jgi:hypothetical protein
VERSAASASAQKILGRFDALIEQGESIKETCRRLYFGGNKRSVDPEHFAAWKTSCLSLLKSTFGSSSPQFDSFAKLKFFDYYNCTQNYLGILKGAREDLRNGYFFHKDLMLSVNIYDSLIGRAALCLKAGRCREAQAILDAVLAELLGKICDNKGVLHEHGEEVPALTDKLGRSEVLPPEICDQLLGLHAAFQAKEEDSERLCRNVQLLLGFLNEYLGAQIVILN